MVNRTFSSIAIMIALGVLSPMQANAFGLGKLELSSALNEPFKAEIPVHAMREDEQGNLQVRLATNNEFARAGIERSYYLTQLEFNVVEISGITKIEISSKQPIKEPFVDFLLTATTGDGRLIREYTVLLDPPKTMFVKPAQVVAAPAKAKPAPTQTKSSAKTTYQYPDSGYQAPSTNYYSGSSYGPTTRDDTLWDIALATKPSSAVSIYQMMMALFDANPDAFIKNNINNLKTGQTLTIPSTSEITSTSNKQAIARASDHYQQWKAANRVVAATTELTANESGQATSDSDQVMDSGETDTARLQLVVASDDPTSESDLSPLGNDALNTLRDQLTLAQETIEGQEQETVDFKARMDAMEEQLEIMRRIISVKDSDLARLQGMLSDEDQQLDLASDDAVDELESELEEASADAQETVEGVDAVVDEMPEEVAVDEMTDDAELMIEEAAVDAVIDEMVDDADSMVEEADINAVIDEMTGDAEAMLEEASSDAGIDELVNDFDSTVEEASVDAVIDEMADDTDLMLDEMSADASIDELVDDVSADTGIDELTDDAEAMLDDAPVEVEAQTSSDVADYFAALDNGETYYPSGDEFSDDGVMEDDVEVATTVETEQNVIIYDRIKNFIADYKTALLSGLGALFLGLIALMVMRRRNQDAYEWVDTDSLEGIDASEVELADVADDISSTEIDEVAEQESAIDDVAAVTEEPLELPEEEPANIDDLLNQAEMSIAYGEYDQALEAVEQAKQIEPQSQAVALKLVALAYYQKQPEQFNQLVADIDIDKSSAEWQEIEGWGRELVPENELFSQEPAAELELPDSVEETLTSVDIDSEPELIISTEENDESIVELDLDEALVDVSLEEDDQETAAQELSFDTDFELETGDDDDDDALEFDLEITEQAVDVEGSVTEDSEVELTLDTDSEDDDLELILETDDLAEDVAAEDNEIPTLEIDELETSIDDSPLESIADEPVEELDIGIDDFDFDEVDEAETKLDLAAAYTDMGDPEGARNILEEVLKEGSDEQKSRAQDLLNNLA